MKKRQKHIRLVLLLMLTFISYVSFSQSCPTCGDEPIDPGAMTVYTVQNLNFGSFTQGASGGTVTISNNGTRSTTGTVVALNIQSFNCAIFEIDTPKGSVISVTNGPDATLTGSNGGSMNMSIGPSSPASPFTTTVDQPTRTSVYIGGTLTVGNATASPPGNYTGTFYVTFHQQ